MRFWEFNLYEAVDRERVQKEQTQSIKKQLSKLLGTKASIPLQVGDRTVSAANVLQILGNKKADIAILNEIDEQVAWISLKENRKSQWGGFIQIKESSQDHEWLDIFAEDVRMITQGIMLPGESLRLDKISEEFEKSVIYGKDYSSGKRGIHNVDIVLMGDMIINKDKDVYSLDATTKYVNGQSPQEPVIIHARYTGGYNALNVKNCYLSADQGISRSAKPIDTPAQVQDAMKEFHARRAGQTQGLRVLKTRQTKPLTGPYKTIFDALDILKRYLKKINPQFLSYYNFKDKMNAIDSIASIMKKHNDPPELAINKWKQGQIAERKNVTSKRR
jgi:hypothetical protein